MHRGSTSPLRAAVVGFGAYGRLHARKYAAHPGIELAAIVDRNPQRRAEAARAIPGVQVCASAVELAGCIDLASVVVPASAHVRTATALLDAGIAVLLEKPFTTSVADARMLAASAARSDCVLQAGYLERFNSAVRALRRCMPAPRYVEARRLTAWRGRGGDVSVVLDLMIHDIDIVLGLIDAPLTEVHASGVKVFSGEWDVANARLRFADGSVANLTASRASPVPERRLHAFSGNVCALADIDAGTLQTHERLQVSRGVVSRERACRCNDPLGAEIDAFIESVRGRRAPPVTALDACRALEVAERILDAIEHDDEVLSRIAAPLTDSKRAIALLMQRGQDRLHG